MDAIRRFMIGRNGPDSLSYFLLGAGFLTSIFSTVFSSAVLNIFSTILLVYVFFRMFSKNIYARSKENLAFLQVVYAVKKPFLKLKNRHRQKQFYKFYKCPSCNQMLRVPKNKGTIKIKCPKCSLEFIKKT